MRTVSSETPSRSRPSHGSVANAFSRRLAARVRDGDFHEDVLSPMRDCARLLFHLVEYVGEDFERNRQLWDELDDVAGERLVVIDARSAHQGRIRREARNDGIGRQLRDRVTIGAVSEYLDAQLLEYRVHSITGSLLVRRRI